MNLVTVKCSKGRAAEYPPNENGTVNNPCVDCEQRKACYPEEIPKDWKPPWMHVEYRTEKHLP